jgi:hypothetical protein
VYWSMTFRVSSYILLLLLFEAQGLLDTSGSVIFLGNQTSIVYVKDNPSRLR